MRSAFELKRVFRLPDSMSGPGKTGHPGLGDINLDLCRAVVSLGTLDSGFTLCSHPTLLTLNKVFPGNRAVGIDKTTG